MPTRKATLTPEQCRTLSGYLAHFSHPLRLRVICQLAKGQKCVNELVAATGRLQSTVSGQLKYLSMAGIVTSERRGANVYYRLADDRATGLLKHLADAFGMR